MSEDPKCRIEEELREFLRNVEELRETPLWELLEGYPEWIEGNLLDDEHISLYMNYESVIDRGALCISTRTQPVDKGIHKMTRITKEEQGTHEEINGFFRPLLEKLVELNNQGVLLDPDMTHLIALEYAWYADAVVMEYVDRLRGIKKPNEGSRDRLERLKDKDKVVGEFVEKMYDRDLRNRISHTRFQVMESGALRVKGRVELSKEDFIEKVVKLFILGRVFNLAVILAGIRFVRDQLVNPYKEGRNQTKPT